MKKSLFLLAICICSMCSKLDAQNTGVLSPISLHEVNAINETGTIDTLGIIDALLLANGHLKCLPNSCQSTLPVKWLLFEGYRANEQLVKLKWQTANEINNTGFEVERSLGSSTRFDKIGFVAAQAGTSNVHNYSFDDANNFSGISYYRLKQIDVDGRYNYSPVVAIKGYQKNAALAVYPNPARLVLNLSIELTAAATGTVSVYDLSGRVEFYQEMVFKKGTNIKQIPVEKLVPGMYMVKLEVKDQFVKTERFVKQ